MDAGSCGRTSVNPNRNEDTMDPIIAAMLQLIEDRETVSKVAARAYLEAHEDYAYECIAEIADRLEAEIREAVYIA
jgi:hypothetical protein